MIRHAHSAYDIIAVLAEYCVKLCRRIPIFNNNADNGNASFRKNSPSKRKIRAKRARKISFCMLRAFGQDKNMLSVSLRYCEYFITFYLDFQ